MSLAKGGEMFVSVGVRINVIVCVVWFCVIWCDHVELIESGEGHYSEVVFFWMCNFQLNGFNTIIVYMYV